MKSAEFRRWLAKQGVTFGTQTGSHLKLFYQGRQSILPLHNKELGTGLVEAIKKQLGLRNKE
jgi:mRNA interferase HicA